MLDIHHLATGRGDATVVVAPNGLVALIDAGAVAKPDPAQVPARPDSSRAAGEWIARYAQRRLAETGREGLHAAMVTHLHPDHIGGVGPSTPLDASESYRLTGMSDVAAHVPIGRLLDPDYPDYGDPAFEDRVAAENYVAFIRSFVARGGRVERLRVGATGQLLPNVTVERASFSIRVVASRGSVWTGTDSDAHVVFPSRGTLAPTDQPNENASSAAILIAYGPFRYFAGGDLSDWADAGTRPWLNALTPAARSVGQVDVSMLPHHGMFDASSAATVQALAARNWVISAWHAAHPSIDVLERAFSSRLYQGDRDIYATALHPAAGLTMGRLTQKFASADGHVVCRVEPGGARYSMIVTGAADEMDRVTRATAPLAARRAPRAGADKHDGGTLSLSEEARKEG